jgi:4-hydroxy-4-methyl-2-oxoglutarate aldolase
LILETDFDFVSRAQVPPWIHAMTLDVLARLARLDTAAVSDALDRLGLDGAILGLRPVSGSGRIVGTAVTVLLGPADGQSPSRHLGSAAIESAGPNQIIVVANEGRQDCACWGGTLSLASQLRGIEGAVLDGAARDLVEAEGLGFPVYARGAVQRAARGRVREIGWNVPVTVAGVGVEPGDLIIADTDGIDVIAKSHVEAVVAAAEAIVAREALMAEALRAGRPVSDVMGADYEALLRLRPPG